MARPNNRQAKGGFPTKLGEYLATSKPVVLTKVGEIPLFLTDGVNAYLSEPDNAESFAKKLDEALSNQKEARKVGLNGRHLADTVFNYRIIAKI